jgi:hypothetical protein
MQTNILCGKCREVIYTNPSDVPMIIDTPAPVVDDLMVNVECAIAELSHAHDAYTDAKKKFKGLNKQLKHRIKLEMKRGVAII